MKKLTLIFVMAFLQLSCSTAEQNSNVNNTNNVEDVEEDTEEDASEELVIIPWEQEEPEPDPECISCEMYFCPPLDEVWRKEICMNICDDPPTLYSESECFQYMECDPTQYLIDELECVTEDGYPGVQQKVCNKGLIQYTDCATSCEEESCNYEDDDCDGEIDEGQLNECNECGIIPPEVCDGIDNDCDGITDEELIQACTSACGAGYEICYEGNWISCNAPPENDEICDGLDNDCDGQIDENLDCVCTIQDLGVLFPCQDDPLICGQGYKTCECLDPDCIDLVMTECYALCYWVPSGDPNAVCDPLIGMELNQEKCNNFDDNCNQQIDEDLYGNCYTGPEGTLMVGICVPGEMTCDAGTWGNYDSDETFVPYFCKDEVVPQQEICNGLDDDCDGIADWGEEMKETDVLFIVDWSGSMSDEMDAVLVALNQFAQNFSDEEVIKWSFVRGPVAVGPYNERLELVQDLIGFSDFLISLAGMDASMASMSTAFEMLLDAIYISVHNITSTLPQPISDFSFGLTGGMGTKVVDSEPPLQNFDISWRSGADRIIIVFSDEVPQSYLVPELSIGEVKTAVAGTPQLKLYTFSRSAGAIQWEELANAGNGSWYKLTNNPTEMYASLMEILDEICKGGNDEE